MSSWNLAAPGWLLGWVALAGIALWRDLRGVTAVIIPHAFEWRVVAPRPGRWIAFGAYTGLALVTLALARPQRLEQRPPENRVGYDVILALDLSTSMYAEDFQRDGRQVNRLQAVKPIVEAFINRRPDDRIGIVIFAGRAYTFAPLTFDHEWLRRQTGRLAIGAVEDGTAIGDALGVALARLQQGAKDKAARRLGAFVVLLTDGASNRGALDPRQSARLLAEQGVPVFTIGAGAEGRVPMPVFDAQGTRVGTELREAETDDLLLRDIAETTNGLFFRATDATAIEQAFAQIDAAAPRESAAPALQVSHELFPWPLVAGLILLAAAAIGAVQDTRSEAFA